MEFYTTKIKKLPGTSYSEVLPQANAIYKSLQARTKRRPYLRSAYFKKEKIFLDYFWHHLREKRLNDRMRRLQYYACGLDLIAHSHVKPIKALNPNRPSEVWYRFVGKNGNGEKFTVQIKENKDGEKSLMSIYPCN